MFPSFFHYATRPADRHDHRPTRLRYGAAEAPVTIRLARTSEAALDRLAALDGGAPLRGPGLVAELEGRPIAALDLRTGASMADPFARSAPLLELLRVRAAQIGALR